MEEVLTRVGEFLLECLRNWVWFGPMLAGGFFLYKTVSAFLPLKPGRAWRAALIVTLGGSASMVIWVGDNNLLFTLPVFVTAFLLCSRGNLVGRLVVAAVFFCLIMPVNAVMDTYYAPIMHNFGLDDVFDYSDKIIRPVIWALLYLAVRKRLPERPPQLSPKLWRLTLLLSAMPLSAMLAVVLLTYARSDYAWYLLHGMTMNLGLAVLPMVFLTALSLLYALLVLADHERLEQADRLASLRESYYQALRREERQVRTIRHDLRNHLTAVRGLLEEGAADRAMEYLNQLAASPALSGSRRLCENETANAVLAAKAEAMAQAGVEGDFAVSLPKYLPIADVDLCALLGNALDNAMEAAAGERDKRVAVRCRAEKGLFMLRVDNAAGEARPDLSTTKPNPADHGFGLPGMREIAQRWGGTLEAGVRDGRFELVVCIPIC